MPYLVGSILRANELLAPSEGFEPDAFRAPLDDAVNLLDGAERLALFDVLPDDEHRDALREFLGTIPPALDAAILGAVRDALTRGVRTQLSWQPGYDFEVRLWEQTAEADGVLNVHVVSPVPDEPSH